MPFFVFDELPRVRNYISFSRFSYNRSRQAGKERKKKSSQLSFKSRRVVKKKRKFKQNSLVIERAQLSALNIWIVFHRQIAVKVEYEQLK